jgi:hypothetical protein
MNKNKRVADDLAMISAPFSDLQFYITIIFWLDSKL